MGCCLRVATRVSLRQCVTVWYDLWARKAQTEMNTSKAKFVSHEMPID